jgi:hypothetical protein
MGKYALKPLAKVADRFRGSYRRRVHMGSNQELVPLALTSVTPFSKHGLNYVIDTYLPEKLKHPERFLP